jgi:hypothetical protein
MLALTYDSVVTGSGVVIFQRGAPGVKQKSH